MRFALSPLGFALLGGVDVAALALALRKLLVARAAAAGDMAAAMELSALGHGFGFVTGLAFAALVLTAVGCGLLGARRDAGHAARLLALPALALALALAAFLTDQPSATTDVVVRAHWMWVASTALGIGAALIGGVVARARAET